MKLGGNFRGNLPVEGRTLHQPWDVLLRGRSFLPSAARPPRGMSRNRLIYTPSLPGFAERAGEKKEASDFLFPLLDVRYLITGAAVSEDLHRRKKDEGEKKPTPGINSPSAGNDEKTTWGWFNTLWCNNGMHCAGVSSPHTAGSVRLPVAILLKPSCLWCSGDRDGSSTDRGGELSIPRSSLRTSIKHQGQLPPTWSLSGWRESEQNKKNQNKNKNRLTTGRKITTEWDYFSLITTAALHFPGNVGCEKSWDTLTGTILDLKKTFLIVN